MQFIDLKAQYRIIQADLQQRMTKIFEHSQYILGPEVTELEEKLAHYTGAKHCISVANGTDALLMAMMALNVGPGDEIITSPFTFAATVEMAILLGAIPVFVDIDPKTYNINPDLIAAAITSKTKLILPINLYGQCADFDKINAIAKKHKLYVVEDAGQSFGATYKGRQSGNLGTIGCTSFFPSKPLGCYGDGGACFTDDDELAKILRQIRNHGQDRRYHHIRLGLNSRLDTLQAAVLLAKLVIFPEEIKKRDVIAENYARLLKDYVTVPTIASYNHSTYAQYTIEVANRDHVVQQLEKQKIPTAVHYPVCLHQQDLLTQLKLPQPSLPNAEHAAEHVLSLPFHPYLADADMQQIAKAIVKATAVNVAA